MTRRSTTFLIAACLSAGMHAAMFLAFPHYEVGGIQLDGPHAALTPAAEMTVVLEPEPEPRSQAEKKPASEFEMGEEAATGYASHEIPDKVEATAPEADADQAFLSLDPAGAGERGSDPAISEATGEGSTIGQPGRMPPSPPAPPPLLVAAEPAPTGTKSLTPFGLNPELKLPRMMPKPPPVSEAAVRSGDASVEGGEEAAARPVAALPKRVRPPRRVAVQPVAVAVAESQEPPQELPPTPIEGGSRAGGARRPAADPARMSDSESDPFSRLGTALIHDGRLQIRFGRKVKTRRPKLLLAAQADLLTLRQARVVLNIEIDASGKVTSVKVDKSSGSNEIDQPTRLAVYEWWFEPRKDASGRPVADEVEFTIHWR